MRAARAHQAASLVILSLSLSTPALGSGFIENRGQIDERVRYYALGSRGAVYLTSEALVFDLKEPAPLLEAPAPVPDPLPSRLEEEPPVPRPGCAVYMRFEGANPSPVIEARGKLETEHNYFLGSDPSNWWTAVPSYEEVVYRGLWPGVDLVFREEGGRLVYELEVAPGSDPSLVRFGYEGAAAVTPGEHGTTVIETSAGSLAHQPASAGNPVGWVEAGGAEPASFSRDLLGGERDDPSALLWSTFLGGSDFDEGLAIVLASSGNPVLVGYSNSTDFPATPGAYDTSHGGFSDVFVAELSGTGSTLLWATFLGGSDYDLGYALAVDSTGDFLLTGRTYSSDFPATPGAYDTSHNGSNDAFVAKLSSTGSTLLWSTFLGGSAGEDGNALVLDPSGNPILAGSSSSPDFPATPGAYDTSHNGSSDVFVAKLSGTGASLFWSTFLGGSSDDNGLALALDQLGSAVLTGYTASAEFPTTPGAYDTTANGSYDVLLSKLSSTGSTLLWSTLLGGSSVDHGRALALDPSGNPVVTGYTASTDFPATPWAYDASHNGSRDVIAAKFSASGSLSLWSTFLGGSSDDRGFGLALDPSGDPVLAGRTSSSEFPTTPGAYDTTFGGAGFSDGFIAALSIQDPMAVEGEESRIDASLLGGEPNPMWESVDIRFTLAREARVSLRIFDIAGRAVVERDVGLQAAGPHAYEWDGRDAGGRMVGPGVYFARLEAGGLIATRKIVLVR